MSDRFLDFDVSSSSETPEQIKETLAAPVQNVEPVETAPEAAPVEIPEKPHKEKSAKARIDELTWKAKENERQKDEIARRFDEAQQELSRLKSEREPREPVSTAAVSTGKPNIKDFEDFGEYTEALLSWQSDTKDRERESKAQVQRQKDQYTAEIRSYAERAEAKKAEDPTFFDRIDPDVLGLRPLVSLEKGEQPGPLNALATHIMSSELMPQWMEYLSTNKAELQRFSTLHPLRFGIELGKIEARFEAASAGSAPRIEVSKAKPPVRPVTGSLTADTTELPDDVPFEKFVEHWNAKDRKRVSGYR